MNRPEKAVPAGTIDYSKTFFLPKTDFPRRALAIYPHQPEVEKMVDKLTLDVEGQGI